MMVDPSLLPAAAAATRAAERLTLVLSQVQEMKGLFAGLDATQVRQAQGGHGSQQGSGTAVGHWTR